MTADTATGILQTISNPIRSFLIQSLKDNSMVYSELMRACGLNPNSDTGTFSYHLSVLLDSNIVDKKDNKYQLTTIGNAIANFINSLQRESAFLLTTPKINKGGERAMVKIETKWVGQDDIQDGGYGIVSRVTRPPPKPDDEWLENIKFRNWERSLPLLDITSPGFFGHILGFEKDAIKIGSIHVRNCVHRATGMAIAQILGIYTVDNNYRKVGISRSSMLRQMMEEFLKQAEEHKTQSVEIEKVDAEDEDLTMVLKELGFARYQTMYAMRRTI